LRPQLLAEFIGQEQARTTRAPRLTISYNSATA
jgi:hypothetical protein